MAGPLLFVTTYPVKPGMVDRFKEAVPEWFAFIEANHPRVVIHSAVYVDEGRSEATSVQLHPDAESMDQQFAVLGDRSFEWQEYIDSSQMQILICGEPSDTILTTMERIRSAGIAVTIKTSSPGSAAYRPLEVGRLGCPVIYARQLALSSHNDNHATEPERGEGYGYRHYPRIPWARRTPGIPGAGRFVDLRNPRIPTAVLGPQG